ncbi:hypothetical protein SAMN06265365_11956 [Tistlia consotensis]|uniref:Cytochrome oxidase subunit III n=1 Tax=Tistlia consotensis USBA 355 TaxID=560819 RepID=A0A1Y6CBC9_9PROT|nr:hypothetical protein [Tistlia consotensis]SMF55408.1 hypothetical protein SAMN05428998_12056 [Tistlia consotensis USBA 355]SNR88359.1 hypothetical protein SAMN06265365_11956 [Tistlia consotensis]
MAPRTVWAFNFAGWLLFAGSAVASIISTLRAGDTVGLIASVLFLLACLVFLVPFWIHRPPKERR